MTPQVSKLYLLAADALVVLHLLFILFVISGGLLALRNGKWLFIHLPAALWAATVEFTGWYCPLTPLENWLRLQGGGARYTSSFVEQYLLPLLYPAALTRELQIALGLAVVVLNGLVYFRVYRRRRPAPGQPARQDRPPSRPESSGQDTP
jgi:small-conductance mechanosensitive channel